MYCRITIYYTKFCMKIRYILHKFLLQDTLYTTQFATQNSIIKYAIHYSIRHTKFYYKIRYILLNSLHKILLQDTLYTTKYSNYRTIIYDFVYRKPPNLPHDAGISQSFTSFSTSEQPGISFGSSGTACGQCLPLYFARKIVSQCSQQVVLLATNSG
jgi:hypothetical protein